MRRLGLALSLCLLATGCRHKPPAVVAIALPPSPPVALDKTPEPVSPPMVQPVPAATAPLPAVVVMPKKAKKPRRKPAPAPVQVASAAPAVLPGGGVASTANVIGSLTAGGGDSAAKHQKAADLLSALDKRLTALPAAVVESQREQVLRVRHFWADARAALNAGDSDAAWNLATKAKVLLDDVAK